MRFVLFLILIAVAIGVFSASDEKLSKHSKISIVVLIAIIAIGVGFYEKRVDEIQTNKNSLVVEFNRGKTLKCGTKDVNNSVFNYEFGTSSFVPKNEFSALKGVIINIKDCKIDE